MMRRIVGWVPWCLDNSVNPNCGKGPWVAWFDKSKESVAKAIKHPDVTGFVFRVVPVYAETPRPPRRRIPKLGGTVTLAVVAFVLAGCGPARRAHAWLVPDCSRGSLVEITDGGAYRVDDCARLGRGVRTP
jgi:hypothetical protein